MHTAHRAIGSWSADYVTSTWNIAQAHRRQVATAQSDHRWNNNDKIIIEIVL